MNHNQCVSYRRVSTGKKGRSGLGLEAQQNAVQGYISTSNSVLIAEFTEIESGRRVDRPELQKALELCRRRRATLVIAKLDRLARNVAFVSSLLEGKVKFVAVDMLEADVTFLQMAAVFGEWEARRVSERTKAALAASKARGKLLGWSMPSRILEQKIASQRGANRNRELTRQFAANILPIIQNIQGLGMHSFAEIATTLNERGVRTARDRKWYSGTVRRLLARTSEL